MNFHRIILQSHRRVVCLFIQVLPAGSNSHYVYSWAVLLLLLLMICILRLIMQCIITPHDFHMKKKKLGNCFAAGIRGMDGSDLQWTYTGTNLFFAGSLELNHLDTKIYLGRALSPIILSMKYFPKDKIFSWFLWFIGLGLVEPTVFTKFSCHIGPISRLKLFGSMHAALDVESAHKQITVAITSFRLYFLFGWSCIICVCFGLSLAVELRSMVHPLLVSHLSISLA